MTVSVVVASASATPLAIAIIGTFGTLIAGVAAFINGWRSHRLESQIVRERNESAGFKSTADLQQAEIVGWQTLIETTRHQYQNMVDEAGTLTQRLAEKQTTNKRLEDEADEMRDRIALLEREVSRYRKRGPDVSTR